MDNRKISICLPTYNRYSMTVESFIQVIDDDRISEVIIVDDCSTDNAYERLLEHFQENPIVKVLINADNEDCYKNKQIAISHTTNEWCVLLDSDNIIDTTYLDALYSIPDWNPKTIYQPVFARPHFDFRHLSGLTIDRNNLSQYAHNDKLQTAFNAMNFFVNKQHYLLAFDDSVNPHTSDSIYMAYRLLSQDNQYYFVPGLEYEHRVGHPSHYTINNHKTGNFHNEVLQKLYNL